MDHVFLSFPSRNSAKMIIQEVRDGRNDHNQRKLESGQQKRRKFQIIFTRQKTKHCSLTSEERKLQLNASGHLALGDAGGPAHGVRVAESVLSVASHGCSLRETGDGVLRDLYPKGFRVGNTWHRAGRAGAQGSWKSPLSPLGPQPPPSALLGSHLASPCGDTAGSVSGGSPQRKCHQGAKTGKTDTP